MVDIGKNGRLVLGLYREILRLHRKQLPPPMREFGDKYVKSEFKAHWNTKTTEQQWNQFQQEWSRYLYMLKGQGDMQDNSGDLTPDLIDSLSNEQRMKLTELRNQARKFGEEILQPR
eukprot:TRINITY_DN8762_c0_g1_i1.p3 TRINITY_DN8762_c0_g1~~TRINITY_DN8762_c0_g1_i1.p3  ORF type:complete len:117 (-),score=9.76 TRINITY_DN8762_c0_g1_i1:350-700(-)